MTLITDLGVEGPIIDAMPLGPDSLVWIVGAFKGKTAELLRERFDPYMVAFDPQQHAIENLREVARHNPKLEVMPFGLDAWTSRMKMYAAGSDACTVYPAITDRPETEIASFVDVAEYVTELDANDEPMPDLALINCEGGEFKIIPRLDEMGKLSEFPRLLIQFHVGAVPAHIYESVLATLDRTHTRAWGDHLPSWGLWTA